MLVSLQFSPLKNGQKTGKKRHSVTGKSHTSRETPCLLWLLILCSSVVTCSKRQTLERFFPSIKHDTP